MIKKIVLILTISLFPFITGAETRFSLDWKTDIISGTFALGTAIPPFFFDSIPQDTISSEDIFSLDQLCMFEYNSGLDTAGLLTASVMLMIPAASLVGQTGSMNTWLTYSVMYAEAFLLTMGTKNLLKSLVPRNRPYTYFGPVPGGEENDYYNSFPSGHTSFAFLGAAFLAVTFSYDHPESRWKIPLIAGSYTLASSVAVLRILSGNHFPTDVLTGAVIGSFYGWLVPILHVKNNKHISVTHGRNGILIRWEYK